MVYDSFVPLHVGREEAHDSMICARCGFQSYYEFQACPNCLDPVITVVEVTDRREDHATRLSEMDVEPIEGCQTRTPFDRISEHGMPYGASMLLSGPAGCGKSSWALRIAEAWDGQAWYFPFERGPEALRRDAERLNVNAERIWVCSPDADPLAFYAPRGLLIIDSLNEFASRRESLLDSVRSLAAHAREMTTSVLMLAHVTKDWELSGPERMKHEVDVHMEMFPPFRIRRTERQMISCPQKNRYGPLWKVLTEPAWMVR